MAQRASNQKQSSQSLETVTPLASGNLEDDDLRLSLEYFDEDDEDLDDDDDLDSYSDGDYESDVTLEEVEGGGLDLPKGQRSEQQAPAAGKAKNGVGTGACTDLVPAGVPDPYDVDSEEENELLRGIKDEIKDMVRAEMKSELAVYEHKVKTIEAGRLPSAPGGDEPKKHPNLEDMEPELREAYIKMWKLDRILAKRMKKEKEVKRERILLERRVRDEINSLPSMGRVQRDIKANTERYLSLSLPESHNEGVVVDERPVTPVFQTQVNEQDLRGRGDGHAAAGRESVQSESRHSSAAYSHTNNTETTEDGQESRKHGHRKKRKKDFIKRNKELAANAGEAVVMTDDEKKRLQDLLTDIDAMPDIAEEGADDSSTISGLLENPFQVIVHPGEGFLPSASDFHTLSSIDQRLQSIMPEEEFRSIASSSLSSLPQQRLFTRRVSSHSNLDYESYGERALIETKEEREMQAKLKQIEERLIRFQNVTENSQGSTPPLTSDQLDSLLDECVRSMSCISAPPDTPHSVNSERSLESARAQMMLNPPRLTDEQLQKLLSEAHFPLSTRLLSLQDDDRQSAQSAEEGEAIRAETWKAIAEAMLSEDEEEGQSNTPMLTTTTTPQGTHPSQRLTRPPVRPTLSESNMHPTPARQAFLRRSGSQLSDSDSCESHISLPEICTSPFLINTPQGQRATMGGLANNDPGLYRSGSQNGARVSASFDDRVHNDLSVASAQSSTAAFSGRAQQISGTPLQLEDFNGESTPTPHPPPSSERHSSGGTVKSRGGSVRESKT